VSVLSYECCVTVIAMAVLISKRQICLSDFLSRTSSPYNICFIHVNANMSGERNEPLTSVWITKRDLLETAC